jgi:secreted PhoX family phosphatase
MTRGAHVSRREKSEDPEDIGSNRSGNPTIGDVIAERLSRRDLAKGVLAVSAIAAIAELLPKVGDGVNR